MTRDRYESAVATVLVASGATLDQAHHLLRRHERTVRRGYSRGWSPRSSAARVVERERARRRAERDPALDKKALWRSIEADEKKRNRERVASLRGAVREARGAAPAERRKAREICRIERQTSAERAVDYRREGRREIKRRRETLKEKQARERAELREKDAETRAEVQRTAAFDRKRATDRCADRKAKPAAEVQTRRAALEAERAHQRAMRRLARAERERERGGARRRPGPARARERMAESDDEVRQNIPSDLIPLFERVRRSIKGSARRSRTEAFLQYVEEHPGEEIATIEDETERMIREHERSLRRGGRGGR